MAYFKLNILEALDEKATKATRQKTKVTPSGYNFSNDELRVNSMGSVYIVEAKEEKDKVSSKKIRRLMAVRR